VTFENLANTGEAIPTAVQCFRGRMRGFNN